MTRQSRRIPAASFRLPGDTLRQIEELTEILGMTKTGVLSRAIDRLHKEEINMKDQIQLGGIQYIEGDDTYYAFTESPDSGPYILRRRTPYNDNEYQEEYETLNELVKYATEISPLSKWQPAEW